MTIELRSITVYESMSEETNCYVGKLYWKGKRIADVSNRGFGGPDEIHILNQPIFDEAVAYVKSLPAIKSEYFPDGLPMDLELWCSEQVEAFRQNKAIRRMFKRDLKRSVVFARNGEIFTVTYKGVKEVTPRHFEACKAKHPDAVILNTMPENAAFEIYAPLVAKGQ